MTAPVKGLSKQMTTVTFLMGIFMGALDHGIVGPALSSIMAAYGIETSWGVWSFTIYTLLFAVSIPVMGKLSDRFGRKQTFTTGITLFAAGSVLAAFAPSFPLFLLGRAIQAIGTGGIFPITAAQIAMSYPPEKRGRMLGLIGVVFGVGTIMGPIFGGLIIAQAAWRWIFLINVPISIIILALISTLRQTQQLMKKPIDVAGILLLTVTILTLMLGITMKNSMLILVSLVLVPVLVLVEKKAKDPVVQVAYFQKANTLVLLLTSMVSGFVMASATNLLPFFAESVLGMEKGASGFSVTPLAIASMVASLAGGFMVDKIGAKKVLLLGFAISAAGALSLAFMVDSLALFMASLLVLGFGVGIIIGAPLNVMMLGAVDPSQTGTAVGYLSLLRSLGSTMGPALAGLLIVLLPNGFTVLFAISAVASAISIMLVLLFSKAKAQRA